MSYLVVSIIAVAVAVFAMQNTTRVDVSFLAWQIAQVPVAAVVLATLGAGLVIAGFPLWFQLWRVRRRAAALESSLEHARAAASRTLTPPPPGGAVRPPDRPRPAAGAGPDVGRP
jgi:uncharacterized integral membrane protein